MRLFELHRSEDISGSSGTGTVAQGVVFSDGKVAMRWLVSPFSTAFYDAIEDVQTIHGHGERTQLVFLSASV